jgi:hypothetical protein
MYPKSEIKEGIAIAVDEVSYPQRVIQYFGMDLTKAEVLPINIIVSNHGQRYYRIRPSDILLMQGKDVIDPAPVELVQSTYHEEYGRMSGETAKMVNDYFGKVMLREVVVAPQTNYQGILFLKADPQREDRIIAVNQGVGIAQLLQERGLKIRIAVTDVKTSERIHFGPFSLTGL